MPCQNVRQILAKSFDQPLSDWQKQEVAEHLEGCRACRRDEFYFKQLSHISDLLIPYQVSPNFSYKLEIRMAHSERLPALKVKPGMRERHSWYFSLASASALAVLALLLAPWIGQKETEKLPPVVLESTPAQELNQPFPLLAEEAQASERPAFRLRPESPLAAQFATALSEPIRPGFDGEESEGWQDEYYLVGSSDRGLLMPARHYGQPAASSQAVLLLPASTSSQEVNVVY
jgi:hypothetical protein